MSIHLKEALLSDLVSFSVLNVFKDTLCGAIYLQE